MSTDITDVVINYFTGIAVTLSTPLVKLFIRDKSQRPVLDLSHKHIYQHTNSKTSRIARLNGTVNPNGSPTTVWFEWGKTLKFGNTTKPELVHTEAKIVHMVQNLAPGTTYYYRLILENEYGIAVCGTNTFKTKPSRSRSSNTAKPKAKIKAKHTA